MAMVAEAYMSDTDSWYKYWNGRTLTMNSRVSDQISLEAGKPYYMKAPNPYPNPIQCTPRDKMEGRSWVRRGPSPRPKGPPQEKIHAKGEHKAFRWDGPASGSFCYDTRPMWEGAGSCVLVCVHGMRLLCH